MSDDIVTKLEFLLKEGAAIIKDQADEIERLREENDKASALIAKLAELLVPYSMLMNKYEQELLIKAVRGE